MFTACAGACLEIQGRSRSSRGKRSVDRVHQRLSTSFFSGSSCDLLLAFCVGVDSYSHGMLLIKSMNLLGVLDREITLLNSTTSVLPVERIKPLGHTLTKMSKAC